MRWPVEVILDMISSGMSASEIIADHPELVDDDIKAALYFAKLMVSGHKILNVA